MMDRAGPTHAACTEDSVLHLHIVGTGLPGPCDPAWWAPATPASAMLDCMKARGASFVLLALALVALTACVPGPNVAATNGPEAAGFWLGLWQGLICPITFIVSLFNHGVSIYEVHNNGAWYNFGFLIGASMVLGGGGAGGAHSARRRSRR